MNNNKVAFIICSNDETMLNECINYLQLLEIPEGIETDLLVIKEAKSMLLGMQEGRDATDAKYKVYLHQDVFIMNRHFIRDIMSIFNSDETIGLIGMVGSQRMPSNGVMWEEKRVGRIFSINDLKSRISKNYEYSLTDGVTDVVAVDGLLMATSADVNLRTEFFDGWDFYDVSTSLEYKRAGYRVVVPRMHCPWVLHDDGEVLSMWNYDKYRQIALKEYTDFIKPQKTRETINGINEVENFFGQTDTESVEALDKCLKSPEGMVKQQEDENYRALSLFIEIYKLEKAIKCEEIFYNVTDMNDVKRKNRLLSDIIYRLAVGNIDEELLQKINEAEDNNISVYAYFVYSLQLNYKNEEAIVNLADILMTKYEWTKAKRLLTQGISYYEKSSKIALKLLELYMDLEIQDEARELIRSSVLKDFDEFKGIV